MVVRKVILVLFLIAFTASLGACGRKNKPVAPEDADPKYPRTYPAPTPMPKMVK